MEQQNESNGMSPQSSSQTSIPPKTSLKRIFLIIFFGVFIIPEAVLFWWQIITTRKLQETNPQPTTSPTISVKQTTPTDISKNVKPSTLIQNWTELSGDAYSISFPNDWQLTKAVEDLNSYVGQAVILTSPSNNTQLIVQPPDGWGHTTKPTKETEISFVVGKNTYIGKEVLFQTATTASIYSYAQVTDLLHQGNPYIIRYGNDYPTYLRNAGKPSTLEQYEQDKQTINKILLTIRTSLKTNFSKQLKTYTTTKRANLSFPSVSIQYPSDWDIHADIDESDMLSLKLTKNGYSITIYQAAVGGAACLFNDSPVFEGPSGDFRSLKYTEMEATFGILRYFINPNHAQQYSFCQKSNNFFGSPTTIGGLTIEISSTINDNVFQEALDIVKSISIN